MKVKFYICKHCGNIIEKVLDSGVPVVCCGDKMTELEPNTSDGALEKHVPEVTVENDKVTVVVGSVPHPMLEEHHIVFIEIVTNLGIQRKNLVVPNPAKAEFVLAEGETLVEVYEYCNLHGLWKKEQ